MSTFNTWPVVPMPIDPPAPASIELTLNEAVAVSMSPFTGQQQTQNWGPLPMEASVTMPALTQAQAAEWVQWLRNVQGMQAVFQFTAAFIAAYPESLGPNQFWRLKGNARKWSIGTNRYYGLHFEIVEAK